MKFILLLMFPIFSYSQKNSHGYGFIGPEGFLSNKFGNRAGMAFGAGAGLGTHSALGFSFDGYFFSKEIKFAVVHGDLTGFFSGLDKMQSPFITISPGYVLYSLNSSIGRTTYHTSGNFAIDILGGVKVRFKQSGGSGFMISGGYSMISFSTAGTKDSYSGGKIRICYSVGK